MVEWFNSMDFSLKFYWGIAVFVSTLFIIQTIMTFIGFDSGSDIDTDFDHTDSPLGLFSLRNLINFLLGFSWTGVCFYGIIHSMLWLNLLALAVGLTFVALFFVAIKQLMKLAVDKTFKMEDTVGKVVNVYLRIPAGKTGKGKIQVSVSGAVHELDAMTEGGHIPTGAKAKVNTLIDNNTVMVTSI